MSISPLHEAIDALVQRTRVKVDRAGGGWDWRTLPSIWEQLEQAIGYASADASGQRQGSSGSYVSKPTIVTGILSLILDIAATSARGCTEQVGEHRHNAPANLRAIAASLESAADPGEATFWAEQVQAWIRDARTELGLDVSRPRWARGARCPECGERGATGLQAGRAVHTPALAVLWSNPSMDVDADWVIAAVQCRACGYVWHRGAGLDLLVGSMMGWVA